MENKTTTLKERWLKVCEFNRALTLAEIEKELIKEGATILTNKAKENIIFHVYTNDDDPQKQERIKNLSMMARAYDLTGFCLSLAFVFDGFYYEINYDDNPFMPITYRKIKVDKDGSYQGARYLYSSEDLNNRSWKEKKELCFSFGYDNFFKICSDEEIKELAQYHLEQIKKELFKGPESASYVDQYHPRNKVYNIYVDDRGFMKDYGMREKKSEEIAHRI